MNIPSWILKDLMQSNKDWGVAHATLPQMMKQYAPNCTKGAELGVAFGSMTSSLLSEIPSLSMICVDSYKPYDVTDIMTLDEPRHEQLFQFTSERLKEEHPNRFSILRMSSDDALGLVDDESLDFVFIDACHQYDAVKKDIQNWQKKVRRGGVISGHDYATAWTGVTKAVNEYAEQVKLNILHHAPSSIWAILKP
jgi:predicted O-methyltransferase YrrM